MLHSRKSPKSKPVPLKYWREYFKQEPPTPKISFDIGFPPCLSHKDLLELTDTLKITSARCKDWVNLEKYIKDKHKNLFAQIDKTITCELHQIATN